MRRTHYRAQGAVGTVTLLSLRAGRRQDVGPNAQGVRSQVRPRFMRRACCFYMGPVPRCCCAHGAGEMWGRVRRALGLRRALTWIPRAGR
eukprot:6465002-Amphidinium_carterae.2